MESRPFSRLVLAVARDCMRHFTCLRLTGAAIPASAPVVPLQGLFALDGMSGRVCPELLLQPAPQFGIDRVALLQGGEVPAVFDDGQPGVG